MQPIPVLDYAPSRASPLLGLYHSQRLPALVLAVGLLGCVAGLVLEAPTYRATAYMQVNLSTPIDIRALETEKRDQLQWLRESAIPAVAWEAVTADLLHARHARQRADPARRDVAVAGAAVGVDGVAVVAGFARIE